MSKFLQIYNATDIIKRAVSAVRVALVEPAATFTSATPSSAAAGADTLLTSAGAHGLTSAVSVGASIYISGGTGWTVGFHAITAIAVDTTGTTIQIDTPYDAGMGAPTIALANTEVTLATVSIPPLFANSYIEIDWIYSWTSSANTKILRTRLNSSLGVSFSLTTNGQSRSTSLMANRNDKSAQLWGPGAGLSASFGQASTANTTTAVDTSTSKDLTLTAQPSTANEVVAIDRYIILVWR